MTSLKWQERSFIIENELNSWEYDTQGAKDVKCVVGTGMNVHKDKDEVSSLHQWLSSTNMATDEADDLEGMTKRRMRVNWVQWLYTRIWYKDTFQISGRKKNFLVIQPMGRSHAHHLITCININYKQTKVKLEASSELQCTSTTK